jgi:hypothetical protein
MARYVRYAERMAATVKTMRFTVQHGAGWVFMSLAILFLAIAVWLLTVGFHLGLAMLALWLNVGIFLVGLTLAMGPPCSLKKIVFLVAVAGFGCVIIGRSEQMSYERRFNKWWQSPQQIERYLRSQTPIGSTERQVLGWLHEHAPMQPNEAWWQIRQGSIPPGSDYPLTTTGGAASMHVLLHGEPERLIPFMFAWDVEGFYTFDSAHRLRDVRVRITVNSL